METLKTALVVVLLLAVLYGVFVVLNKPDLGQPPEMAWLASETSPPEVEYGDAFALPSSKFPPMITEPPEMKSSISPLRGEIMEPPAEVPLDDLVASDAEREKQSREQQADAAEAMADPADAEAPGGIPTFDTRAAVATEADLSPLAPRNIPGNLASVDKPDSGQGSSFYEQPPSNAWPSAGPADGDHGASISFDDAWQMAMEQLNNQSWADALRTLSVFYDRTEVAGRDRQRLLDVLDPLAGKVIYSTEHLLEPPYQVRPGETLLEVSQQYQVPALLLKNINGIADPQRLTPGSVLKVVRGPFRAEITLARDELVLFLDNHYAGRFAVSVGNDPRPAPGEYTVLGKQEGREYYAPDGSRIPPLANDNPYGRWWIDLGGDICIHASAATTPTHGGLGCVALDSNDAADVFGILSIGSKVLIR
jgi:LysM repeat protein